MKSPIDSEIYFLQDGGTMGELIRFMDWSRNPLGAIASWPQSLRTALSICLNSRIVSALYWGPEFRLLYNDAYAPELAERHPRVLGEPMQEVWPEIWDVLGPQLISVVESGHGFSTDRQRLIMNRNGRDEETFWFYSFSPVSGEGGNVSGILLNAVDITAQLRAETALLASREALGLLNDSLAQQVAEKTADRNGLWQLSGDLMLVARLDGVITSVNPAWTDVLGWREDELLGRNLFELIHPDDLNKTIEGAKDIGEYGHSLRCFENRYRHQDGSYRWINWTAGRSEDSIVAVGRDETTEKVKASELALAQDQLRQSQKMEAVGQLTGGLAHDFNNLLAGISGSLELMQIRMRQGRITDVERYISTAQGAVKRAASLTHRLLAFSRRQTLTPSPTDVNRLAQSMEELIQRTVGPTISVEIVVASGAWHALVDPSQLENALLNLCLNARDAMPDGGKIIIETAHKWLDEKASRQHNIPEGPYLSLCVSDTGTGMAPQVIARAFEPFFTTKPLGEGTGLGLSMIYGFAQQSGGQVHIHSEVGQGSTVCIYLPRHYSDAADEMHAEKPPVLKRAEHDKTVLVVDDESTVRMFMLEILEDLGYGTLEAGDSAAGLKILQSDTPIDLLVTDVGLPGGMNGRQMADAARTNRPELKVLFITGYAENAVLGNGVLEPGMAVVTKPFSLDSMAERIHLMMNEATTN